MIKELERLLSNSYAPHDSVFFSAIVRMKDTKTFAGVVVKNDISKTITGLVTMHIGLISALSIITILYFKK